MQDHNSKGKAKFSGRKRNFSQAKWYCQGHIPEVATPATVRPAYLRSGMSDLDSSLIVSPRTSRVKRSLKKAKSLPPDC